MLLQNNESVHWRVLTRSGLITDINSVKTSSRSEFGMPHIMVLTRVSEHFKQGCGFDGALTRRSADVLSALRAVRVINEAKQSIDYLPLQIT